MKWINLDITPAKHTVYWCRPTIDKRGYSALYWDGKSFSAGKFEPKGLTHYCEMRLEEPPKFEEDPPELKGQK